MTCILTFPPILFAFTTHTHKPFLQLQHHLLPSSTPSHLISHTLICILHEPTNPLPFPIQRPLISTKMTLQISLKSDTSPNPPHTPPSLSLPKEDSSPQSNSHQEGSEAGRTQNLDHASAADGAAVSDSLVQEENGRERLKRHRMAVAGQVWIPEKWGKEELLKDWIDGSAFEASLFPSGVASARLALVREGREAITTPPLML